MSYWVLASSAFKFLALLAMAGVIGGAFSLWLSERLRMAQDGVVLRYVSATAVLGLISACGFFLIQIGALSQTGLAGMFDAVLMPILAQSALGYVAALRLLGFAGMLVASLWLQGRTRMLVFVCSIVLLGLSFSLTGHISTLSFVPRLGIVLHVLAAFMWVGSLYPLLRLSVVEGPTVVKRLMVLFGNLAVYVVGVLLLSGTLLLTRTLGSPDELFTTAYGLAILTKLSGVVLLLGLAAANKLMLVPALPKLQTVGKLRLSIRTEILVASFVLAVTAWLTTVIGPMQ